MGSFSDPSVHGQRRHNARPCPNPTPSAPSPCVTVRGSRPPDPAGRQAAARARLRPPQRAFRVQAVPLPPDRAAPDGPRVPDRGGPPRPRGADRDRRADGGSGRRGPLRALGAGLGARRVRRSRSWTSGSAAASAPSSCGGCHRAAREEGIDVFTALLLAENHEMRGSAREARRLQLRGDRVGHDRGRRRPLATEGHLELRLLARVVYSFEAKLAPSVESPTSTNVTSPLPVTSGTTSYSTHVPIGIAPCCRTARRSAPDGWSR